MEIASESNVKDKSVQKNRQKICLVCGDKALGYNFNAISCESCKAFFRRNALTNKETKCAFSNNCEITVVTRRFCQKCRLEKCLSVGMVKEFILSDEDKAEKRRKIEENKAKKRQLLISDDSVSSSKTHRHGDHLPNLHTPSIQEPSGLQYDVLNSTSCSPQSIAQSPLSKDIDNSVCSPPIFNKYDPVQKPEQLCTTKVTIDEKTNIGQELYEERYIDKYNICNSVNNLTTQNSIRSILSYSEIDAPMNSEGKDSHVCEEMPITSSNPNVTKARDILQNFERIKPNSCESILCEAIKLEFEAYSSISRSIKSSLELNEMERAKLHELIVASKPLNVPIDDEISQLFFDMVSVGLKVSNQTTDYSNDGSSKNEFSYIIVATNTQSNRYGRFKDLRDDSGKHDPRLVTLVHLTAVAIRRLIKASKKINAFKNMCEEDQVALLKGGCIEMMVLRGSMTYNEEKNQWKVPHNYKQFSSISTDVLKLAKGDVYRSHDTFLRSFEPRWRTDENIILIISAILLFCPYRARVVHKDVIKLEQNSYYYLLRRYLESKYPGCEAKSTFLKLIQKILELRKLGEELNGVYLDVHPIEPLLMEIFDLKKHGI